MKNCKLHELIHSLTMSEKRHFNIFAERHVISDKNQYKLLFNAIDQLESPNDLFLKQQNFVKNLSAEKNYLYRTILKSLNHFHSEFSSKTKIYKILESVEILYHKGLYAHCEKLLDKAEKLASSNELFTHHLTIKELQTELLSKKFEYALASDNIVEADAIIEKILDFNTLQKITTDAYLEQMSKGNSRTKDQAKSLKKQIDKAKKGRTKEASSQRMKMYQLGLELTYAYYVGDSKDQLEKCTEMTNLYESNPHLQEYSRIGYVSSLFNLINANKQLKNYDKCYELIEKMEAQYEIPSVRTSPNICARIYIYSTNLKLILSYDQMIFNELSGFVDQIPDNYIKHAAHINKAQYYEMCFYMARHYFCLGEFKTSLKYTNIILNDTSFKFREDLTSITRLLNILIHYELGNGFTLDYLAKSTMSYFKRKSRLFEMEDHVLRFIKHQDKVMDRQLKKKDLEQLIDSLNAIKQDTFQRTGFTLFDIVKWAEAKLEDKLISEL